MTHAPTPTETRTRDRPNQPAANSVSIQSIIDAQLLAGRLDLRARLLVAHALEVLLAGAVLGDPLARELAGLDLGEDLLHLARACRR